MKEQDNLANGKLKFYNEELEVSFPIYFASLRMKLSEMLDLEDDSLKYCKLFYKDDKQDKKEIKNNEDYSNFIKYIKENKEIVTLEVEAREDSNIDISNCSQSILSFKEKIKQENTINNNNIINNNSNINNNNIIRDNNQQSNNNMINNLSNGQNLAYPESCYFCKVSPLYKIMYYCKDCKICFCFGCELKYGYCHPHSYCKIQNTYQYEYLQIGKESRFEKMVDHVGNKMGDAYNSFMSFIRGFRNKGNNANNNNNNFYNAGNNNISQPSQYSQLIAMARSQYDLTNISDQKIEDALKQCNGDIESAIIMLISHN